MKGWTGKDVLKLQGKGRKVKGMEQYSPPKPKGIEHIQNVLEDLGLKFKTEYKFSKTTNRKFRFDFYVEDLNLAVEYEGLVSEKSRHTTLLGYSKDCTKYNLAAKEGIFVFRYTALNFEEFKDDVLCMIKNTTR